MVLNWFAMALHWSWFCCGRLKLWAGRSKKSCFNLEESVVEQVLHLPPSWSRLPFLKRFLFEWESQITFGWMSMWQRPEDPNGSWRGCWGQGIGIQRHTSRRPWHEFFLHFLLLKICNTFLWSNIHLVSLYTKSSQKTLKTYFQGVMLLLSVCQLGEGRVIKNW